MRTEAKLALAFLLFLTVVMTLGLSLDSCDYRECVKHHSHRECK
jgi:hypothetical protein